MIDIFRASSTMCALVESAPLKTIVHGSIAEARRARDNSEDPHSICIGEQGGKAPQGFAAGNSPAEIRSLSLANDVVHYATTNGTRMLKATSQAPVQLVGCFGNIHLLVTALHNAHVHFPALSRILLCCSGNEGTFSLEDSFFAGAFIARYIAQSESYILTDAAKAAFCIASAFNNDSVHMARHARHAQLLRAMGFAHDVEFCTQEQTFDVVPSCVFPELTRSL